MIVMVTECNPGVGDSTIGYITAVGTLTAVSTVTTTTAIHHCHLSALLDFSATMCVHTQTWALTYIHDGLVVLV